MRLSRSILNISQNILNQNKYSTISRVRFSQRSKPEDVYIYAQEYFSYFNNEKDLSKLKPIVICGPSGVGKGTLLNRLLALYPKQFEFSVSSTTRNPRPGEVHGKHYFFVSKEEFQREIEKNAFVEYCEVHGNYYGTHFGQINDVIKQGKICVLEIDVQGAEKIHTKLPDQFNYVFINAQNIDIIKARLTGRGTEPADVIEKRIANAAKEIQRSKELGIFTEIINDKVEDAEKRLLVYLKEYYPQIQW